MTQAKMKMEVKNTITELENTKESLTSRMYQVMMEYHNSKIQ
jgi:hemoglobin-like flavoprotein